MEIEEYQSENSEANHVKKVNDMINRYEELDPETQELCWRQIIQHCGQQIAIFLQKIKNSNVSLKQLNLIVGATGAGKSTLFNFLNDVPLIVSLRKSKNEKGQQIQSEDPILLVNEKKLKDMPNKVYAPIGSTFTSETTIPNFAASKTGKVAYVDCAGEFDNKDILQSIINSYFKYDLAEKAEKVKLTIAFNYQALNSDRGNSFKKLMQEVGKFIGLWDEFIKSQSVSLVVTNAPRSKNIIEQILADLHTLCKQSKDIKELQPLLKNIVDRKAVAVFLKPAQTCLNQDELSQGAEPILGYEHGSQYKREQIITNDKKQKITLCSPEIITEILEKTPFMKKMPGLFQQNLQQKAQEKVDLICEDILEKAKEKLLNAAKSTMLEKSKSSKDPQKYYVQIKQKINKSKQINEAIQIIGIEEMKLVQYYKLLESFSMFEKISNIVRVKEKLQKTKDHLGVFITDQINKILGQSKEKIAAEFEKFKKKQELARKKEQERIEKIAKEHQKQIDLMKKKMKATSKQQVTQANSANPVQKNPETPSVEVHHKISGNYQSTIKVVNRTGYKFKEVCIKHGCNTSVKENIEFIRPAAVTIYELGPGENTEFKMGFLTDRPNVVGNIFKLFTPIKNAWGKDYWEIQGVIDDKDQSLLLTTTKSDWYYANVETGDSQVVISILSKGKEFQIQVSMSSGTSTREFVNLWYGGIKRTGWSNP